MLGNPANPSKRFKLYLMSPDCQITTGNFEGEFEYIFLENEKLGLKILVDKGADVIGIIYKPFGVDLVWITEKGLPQKKFSRLDYENDFLFTDTYGGGWQSIFPNGGLPSELNEIHFAQHDEVALTPWSFEIIESIPERISVCFEVFTKKLPFRFTKTFTIESGSSEISIQESVENLCNEELLTMWGQHISFGPPFLTAKSRIILSGNPQVLPHSSQIDPGGRRLKDASEFNWPIGLDTQGSEIDFSFIPKRGTESELLYISKFESPAFRIESPETNLAIDYKWDEKIFPYLWYWQEFGKSTEYPWFGKNFNIGLEPFSSYPTNGISEAVKNNTALQFAPREKKEANSKLSISELQTTRKG